MGVWSVITSKNFLILTLFILATAISIWLLTMPTPTIHTIMFETHKQITSNLKNINVISSSRKVEEVDLDETYLELLGFTSHARLYPDGPEDPDVKIPLVVTAVTNDNYENAIELLQSVKKYLKDKQVLIYDLGLGSPELVRLQKHCNTSTECMVKSFDFDKFPGHVHNMHMKAYKPIAIQQALNEYSAIVWTDAADYFISNDVNKVLKKGENIGVLSWIIESGDSTSALTHPKMFTYFKTHASKYYFQHMVGSEHLVIYNTMKVHKEVMLPWVKCALDHECIRPLGAQGIGCNDRRKPKYLYMGCHHFEASALNIILGQVYGTEEGSYTTDAAIFGKEKEEEIGNLTTKATPLSSGNS